MSDSTPISQAMLDSLWDFRDPAGSAERFRSAADDPGHGDLMRAELRTQLARALGLMGNFDEGNAVLDAALDPANHAPDRVRARVALERGRLRLGTDQPDEAVPYFTLAARTAASAGAQFLALDALHMLALSDAGHEEEWAADGLAVLEQATDARTRRWGVALHNNLGWHLHDSGRPEAALGQFEAALAVAEVAGTPDQCFIGHWAIARCLRTLDRADEALVIQRRLADERPDDQLVLAELAELRELAEATEVAPTIEV